MRSLTQLLRLFYIISVVARYGIDQVLFSTPMLAHLRFVTYINPWNWFRKTKHTRGENIRLAMEELGPIFIKFGQMLSTRPDLLPDDIVLELARLQDQVASFSGEQAQAIITAHYGRPIQELFLEFDSTAFASASMAQVHSAKLLNGREIVIKVLRPNIRKIIQRDINLLYACVKLVERFLPRTLQLRPRAVIAEFEYNLLAELDLTREAANASQLRRNFHQSNDLYVPEVFWDYTGPQVMVMERIHGIPVSDIEALDHHQIDRQLLAEKGVRIFFTQVFRDCFFHADMHPGNIFVSPINPHDPHYIAIDFGIMGSLSNTDQRYLAENILAFFNRDYRRVAELHVASGWINRHTRIEVFESAIRAVCEPIFQRPLKDISAGQMLLRLFQIGRQFNMKIQPQLLLLQKTLLNVEGLGRQLYPDLDLWKTAKPFMQDWLRKQLGPTALLKKIWQNIPYWSEKLPDIPDLVYSAIAAWKEANINRNEVIYPKLLTKSPRPRILRKILVGIIVLILVGVGIKVLWF